MGTGGTEIGDRLDDGYVHFFPAGERAKGEFLCSACGYGVTVWRELPACPMCGGVTWEQSTWSPFARVEH